MEFTFWHRETVRNPGREIVINESREVGGSVWEFVK